MSSSAQVTIEPALRETPAAPKRRRYSIAEKRRMVEESFQPGASVARVARAHGVNANQVFGWRRLYQRGRLGGNTRAAQAVELLPVTVSDSPAVPAPLPPPCRPVRSSCNCREAGCASKALWMRNACALCWAAFWHDRGPCGIPDLDRSRSDRSAAWIHRAQRGGSDEAGTGPILWARVRVSWPAR